MTVKRAELPSSGYAQLPTDEDVRYEQGYEDLERVDEVIPKRTREIYQECREASPMYEFVEAGWFQTLSACVILINTVMVVIELDSPEADVVPYLYWPDQVILSFYVIELLARMRYFGGYFLCGPPQQVAWNCLDMLVVLGGVLDQWLLHLLPLGGGVEHVCKALMLLRLVRAVKIVRVLGEADLSWTEGAKFQSFIGAVIAFNALLMGFETDIDWSGWVFIEQVLLVIYVFELACRLKKYRFSFFYNDDMSWNLLDFTIVVSSVADGWLVPLAMLVQKMFGGPQESESSGASSFGQLMMLMRMLRLLRILRLVRLVKAVRPLFNLVTGVVVAMQGVGWVLLLTIVCLYAMGILTTRLVGHKLIFPNPDAVPHRLTVPFATVSDSMFMLFKLMNGAQSDPDAETLDTLMTQVPAFKFAFVFFMISSSWTMLSILTAVVSETMISTTSQQDQELKLESAEKERTDHIHALKDLFSQLDRDGNGKASPEELREFLRDPQQAIECAKACRIPARDVIQVMQFLGSHESSHVSLETFIESLTEVSAAATEKSILKLEARMCKLEHRLETSSINAIEELRRSQLSWQVEQANMLRQLLNERTAAEASREAFASSPQGDLAQALLALPESIRAMERKIEALQLQHASEPEPSRPAATVVSSSLAQYAQSRGPNLLSSTTPGDRSPSPGRQREASPAPQRGGRKQGDLVDLPGSRLEPQAAVQVPTAPATTVGDLKAGRAPNQDNLREITTERPAPPTSLREAESRSRRRASDPAPHDASDRPRYREGGGGRGLDRPLVSSDR